MCWQAYVTIVEDALAPPKRHESRTRARPHAAPDSDENSSVNARPQSPGRAAFGTAPKRDVCQGVTNISKTNPIATPVPSSPAEHTPGRRSISVGRGAPLTPKAPLPVFNTKPCTPLRAGSPHVHRRPSRQNTMGGVGGVNTPQSAVRARSAIRVSSRQATTTAMSTPVGGGRTETTRRKKDRTSPKTSPVKVKRGKFTL